MNLVRVPCFLIYNRFSICNRFSIYISSIYTGAMVTTWLPSARYPPENRTRRRGTSSQHSTHDRRQPYPNSHRGPEVLVSVPHEVNMPFPDPLKIT
jgi:hypothetical protein